MEILHDIIEEELTEEERFLIEARWFEGLSLRELGQRMGYSHEWARIQANEIQKKIGEMYAERTKVRKFYWPDRPSITVETEDDDMIAQYQSEGWIEWWTEMDLEDDYGIS